ncbi:MAG: hypothetical protein AB7G06_00155 [Bdellovibrionales bacterium]
MKRLILAVLVLVPLSACETWNAWTGGALAPAATADPDCLPVHLPEDAATHIVSKGEGPLDISATVSLRMAGVTCHTADGQVQQEVTLVFDAMRGAALKKGDDISVPYFAAVVDAAGGVSAKKEYSVAFAFDEEMTEKREVAISIGLSTAQAEKATLYIGFDKPSAPK